MSNNISNREEILNTQNHTHLLHFCFYQCNALTLGSNFDFSNASSKVIPLILHFSSEQRTFFSKSKLLLILI